MIEISLALAAASKAFQVIQASVKTGKDASDLIGKLGAFYDAKDKVTEAREELDKNPNKTYKEGSVESYALQAIEAEMKIAKYEEQIKKIFMQKGKTAMYHKMLRIRSEEKYRRTQEKIKQNRIKRLKLEKEQEIKNLVFALIALGICLGGGSWLISFFM